eukprot:UN12141
MQNQDFLNSSYFSFRNFICTDYSSFPFGFNVCRTVHALSIQFSNHKLN